MSNIPRFAAYAAAFEKSYESDDWASVRPFFAEDAVYDSGSEAFMGGHFEGRDAIISYFKAVLDGADLNRADLTGAQFLHCGQIEVAHNWQSAYRDEELACGAALPAM